MGSKIDSRRKFAIERMKLFQREVKAEPWKVQHDEAMRCRDFEMVLQFGIELFDLLIRLDETTRSDVLEGRAPPKAIQEVRRYFDLWLKECPAVEKLIKGFEQMGYAVEHADQFRRRHEEAQWMLGAAKDVLQHERLVQLRDEAIDDLRAGRVEPLGEDDS